MFSSVGATRKICTLITLLTCGIAGLLKIRSGVSFAVHAAASDGVP